jgi:hypothetical protein
MTTDELLKGVAEAAREDEIEEDPRWSALVEGTISAEDRAALDELARSSPRDAEARLLLEPLDEGARARIADRILAQMQGEQSAQKPPQGAEVIPLRPKRRWAPAIAALAVAAAAGLLITRLPRPAVPAQISGDKPPANTPVLASEADPFPASSQPVLASADAPIPAYQLWLVSSELNAQGRRVEGYGMTWSATDPPMVFGQRIHLQIDISPAIPHRAPTQVRGFLIRNGRARSWNVQVESRENGSFRIAGAREALFPGVPLGPWEIVIVLGKPGTLPDANAVVRGAWKRKDAGVQVFHRNVVLENQAAPSPPPPEEARSIKAPSPDKQPERNDPRDRRPDTGQARKPLRPINPPERP